MEFSLGPVLIRVPSDLWEQWSCIYLKTPSAVLYIFGIFSVFYFNIFLQFLFYGSFHVFERLPWIILGTVDNSASETELLSGIRGEGKQR